MNLHRLRRRGARQPRVQLRHRHAAHVESQLDFPLLGANALDPATGRPAFRPTSSRRCTVATGRTIRVGILGLTNPGIAIWDKANVDGQDGLPRPGRAGQEVRARAEDEGLRRGHRLGPLRAPTRPRRTATRCRTRRTPSSLVAQQVPGIDAILFGHAHIEIPRAVRHQRARPASRCCSASRYYWGMRLAVMDLTRRVPRSASRAGGWSRPARHLLNTNTAKENRKVAKAVRGPARQGGRLRQLADRHLDGGDVGGRARSSRTRRSSTSSTTSRPTR